MFLKPIKRINYCETIIKQPRDDDGQQNYQIKIIKNHQIQKLPKPTTNTTNQNYLKPPKPPRDGGGFGRCGGTKIMGRQCSCVCFRVYREN